MGGTGLLGLAGWVFADLALVLSLVLGFGTQRPPDEPSRPEPTEVTTTTAPSAPAPAPTPPGIDQSPICLRLEGVPTDALLASGGAPSAETEELVARIRTFLDESGASSRRAGIVLTFAHGPASESGRARAQSIAEAFNNLLQQQFPDVFGGTVLREFSYGSGSFGRLTGDIYLFTDPAQGPLTAGSAGGECSDG